MPEALSSQARALQALVDADGEIRRDLHRLGLSAEGLRQMGRPRARVGHARGRRSTAAPKSSSGTGKSGTKPTSATGAARPRSSSKLHDYADRRRAARVADGARRRPGHRRPRRRSSRATSSSTCCDGTQLRDRRHGTPTRLRLVPRQRQARRSSTATCAWASPTQLATIDDGFRIVASFPELKTQADRDRRVGSRRLRGVPGAAARLPQQTMYSSYTAASFARDATISPTATA